jgi:predicted  nucleic acid-binding Zn ribbon protein
MFKQKIFISINSNHDREELEETFSLLMSSYSKTGQIMGDGEMTFITKDELVAYQTTLEVNSLSEQFNDENVTSLIQRLEDWCESKIKTEIVGTSTIYSKDVCTCENQDSLILSTNFMNVTSPIDCGKCYGVIPIYKLKKLENEDRYDLNHWEKNYKSCDSLQMLCSVGEEWATLQMTDIDSELTQEGIKVCNLIKEKTGIPTYYVLYNYRPISKKEDKARKCPSCQGEWLLKKPLNRFYNFKCDKCLLLSYFTPNTL